MAKINKALDYNKLLEDQAKGKLLKKILRFPLYAGIKYDGNYSVVLKRGKRDITYLTSGGLEYKPNKTTMFDLEIIPNAAYFVERIGTDGKLGDRTRCALRGPKTNQVAYGHKYMVHDMVTMSEYDNGKSVLPYKIRRIKLREMFGDFWAADMPLHDMEQLLEYLKTVVNNGYEGLMLKNPEWIWKNTKSRNIEFAKYKTRKSADLVCIGTEKGEGKYEDMIGALVLKDSSGRVVSCGSGMSDEDRMQAPKYFIGKVIEMNYEQIIDTYIQPTFSPGYVRYDKDATDID